MVGVPVVLELASDLSTTIASAALCCPAIVLRPFLTMGEKVEEPML